MNVRSGARWLLIAFLLVVPGIGLADRIVLKNGNAIDGEILDEDRDELVVRVAGGGTMVIDRRDVKRIERAGAEATLLAQGDRLVELGTFEAARECFRRAAAEGAAPEVIEARITGTFWAEASWCFDQKNLYGASLALAAVLERDPGHAGARGLRDRLRARKKQQEHLLDVARRATLARQSGAAIKAYEELCAEDSSLTVWLGTEIGSAQALEGHRLYAEGRFSEAALRYEKALELDPRLIEHIAGHWFWANASRIIDAVRGERFQGARAILRRMQALAPSEPLIEFLSGLVCEIEGDTPRARTHYGRFLGRGTTPGDRVDALREEARARIPGFPTLSDLGQVPGQTLSGAWRTAATRSFQLHHHNDTLAARVAEVLERERARIAAKMAGISSRSWDRPCKVYLCRDREEFRALGGPDWSEGYATTSPPTAETYVRTLVFLQDVPHLLEMTVPHEVGHLILRDALNVPPQPWVEEGWAYGQENDASQDYLRAYFARALARNLHIGWDEFLGMQGYPELTRMSLFNAQAFVLVEYLLALGGPKRFVAFVADARKDARASLAEHYDLATLAALEVGIRKHLGL